MKTERKASCPCGSGKEWTACCAGAALNRMLEEHNRRQIHIQKFGHGTPIVTTEYDGERVINVGPQLIKYRGLKTFHDFLIASARDDLFGREWINSELSKQTAEQHPVAQWYGAVLEFQKQHYDKEKELSEAVATGPVRAYLRLAYDLYLLAHHRLLQKKMIKRLKNLRQFQGARYETYVAAAFVKAGFEVVLEDETDTATSHCEFNARHKATGARYSIEAKSRHRAGFLGYPGTPKPLTEIKAEVTNLLRKAFLKRANYERIIFIDINVPFEAAGSIYETGWFERIATQMPELDKRKPGNNPWPPAFVFFTNHPEHYLPRDVPDPGHSVLFTVINIPGFKEPSTPEFKPPPTSPLSHYPAVQQLLDSVGKHTGIPSDFDS